MQRKKPSPEDLMQILDGIEPVRDMFKSMVAAFESDGFTPDQARTIVVGLWVQQINGSR